MSETRRRTILLVDDDPLICQLGGELLEHLGYRVETAGEAAQALEVFQRLERVDLVILDYHLPNGDGRQVLRELRGLDEQVRVLVMSGFISQQELARLEELGIQGFISKPFRLVALQSLIKAALDEAPDA